MTAMDRQLREGVDESKGLEPEGVRRATMWGLAGIAALGLIGIVVYAAQSGRSNFLSVGSTSLVTASAATLVGGLLGFLFAIPRGPRLEAQSPAGGARRRVSSNPIDRIKAKHHRPWAFAQIRTSRTFPIG